MSVHASSVTTVAPMKSNIKIVWGVMILVAILLSNACYVALDVVWRAMSPAPPGP